MTKKRGHGEGSIDQRGENNWRLRYRINGKRFTKPFRGTKTEAQKALRQLLHAGDTGSHVTPDKLTFGAWAVHWLAIGAPSNRRRVARPCSRFSGEGPVPDRGPCSFHRCSP
jgi:integrase